MNWNYNEKRTRIITGPVGRHKKITGHRFSSVLGLNQYQTEFGAWCEIMGLVKLPFEGNKYTEAGKAIEPKQIAYAKEKFPNVLSSEEYYGNSFKEYQYSNYKDLNTIFDGVRDFVSTKLDGVTIAMVGECKTSSKPQDWANNNVPIDYLCQLMLYLYLDKIDKGLFVTSFLSPMDYNNPDKYVVNEQNTKFTVKRLKDCIITLPHENPSVSDESGDWTTNDVRFGGIQDAIDYCELWWKTYVETGISPEFDEKLDKEYLDIIRSSKPTEDNDLITVCSQAIKLAKEIKQLEVSSGLKTKQDELKILETAIKEKMINDNIDSCEKYTLKRASKSKLNEKLLESKYKKIYDECCEETISYTLSKNLKEND